MTKLLTDCRFSAGGFTARLREQPPKPGCERREIARRRTEKEGAEAFSSASDDDGGGGFTARLREQSQEGESAVDLQLLQGVAGRLHEFGRGIGDRCVVKT